jgi:hypothetical protein
VHSLALGVTLRLRVALLLWGRRAGVLLLLLLRMLLRLRVHLILLELWLVRVLVDRWLLLVHIRRLRVLVQWDSLFLHVDGGYAKSRVLVRVFLRKGAWGLGWTKNAGSKAGARAMRQEMGRKKKVKTGYLGLYEGAATA